MLRGRTNNVMMLDDFTCESTVPSTAYVGRSYIAVTNSWTGNTSFNWNRQSPLYFDEPKTESEFRDADIDLILKRHGRALSQGEKAFIRRFNCRLTARGVHACEKRHGEALRFATTATELRARFDRRIPCWRAGRWKSLT